VTARVLGIDPGLRTTGYGVVEDDGRRLHLVEAGIIVPTPGRTLEQRLQQLHAGIEHVVSAARSDCVVREQRNTTDKNPSTAILMENARG